MKNNVSSYLLGWIAMWTVWFSSPLLASTGISAKAKLQQAIASRKSGEFSQAVNLLTPLRATFVNHKRINIELTLNYIKLRQFERAEQLVHHLESLPLTASEQSVVSKLKRVLAMQLRRDLSTHAFNISATSAVGLDILQNNYPVYIFDDADQETEFWSSDDELDDMWFGHEFVYVDYGLDEQFSERNEESKRTEESYFSQAFEGSYRYRPADFLPIFEQPTQLIFDVDTQIKYKHFNRKHNDQYLSYNLDASMYFLQINRWLLELNTLTRIDYVNNDKLVNKVRYRVALSLPFSSSKVKLSYDVSQKRYQALLSEYNATLHVPAFEYTYTFSPEFRLQVGVKYHSVNAKDEYHSYRNKQAYLALYYFPSSDWVFYSSYNHYKLRYEIDDVELVNWSTEDKRSLSLGMRYQVNQSLSFSLSGNIGDNRIENLMGEDSWQRVEASVEYRF